ncbi:hypothetical protein BZZ01_23065 [Nostocales cyanobacterium HT-58-2]|nr:hypothetical protein BZZ01_23065 [Nostocales cyanobacterium HT-58-2]
MNDKNTDFLEDFRVLALDGSNDRICFVVREKATNNKPCWCRANRRIRVGMVVRGRLVPQNNSENLPVLLIED